MMNERRNPATQNDRTEQPDSRETIAPSSGPVSSTKQSGPFVRLPAQFGRFRVMKVLGHGAMGTVYLATNVETNTDVALKIPKADLAEHAIQWERFHREASAVGDLNHPNICKMYAVGDVDGTHFISMEYVEGQPLSDLISPVQSQREVVRIISRLAMALAHAHERDIVHRDLKPANVMIDSHGEPKLMDFGLARRLDVLGDVRATQSGMIVGSPAYMAPEQAQGEPDKIGTATDIYGLGALFFEMLTGSLPFQGSMIAILGQITTTLPPRPSSLRAGISPDLESLCLKMLAKKPQDRPSSMAAVAELLAEWSANESGEQESSAPAKGAVRAKAAAKVPAVDPIESQRQKVNDLVDKHHYPAAIELLEKMVNLRDARFEKLVAWAQKRLPELQEVERKMQDASGPMCATASRLLQRRDYSEAVNVLSAVPLQYRSEQLRDLLRQATELNDQCNLLQQGITKSIQEGDEVALAALVKQLLKLKPGSQSVKKLAEDLKKHGPRQVIANRRGQKKFDISNESLFETKHIVGGVILVAAIFIGTSVLVRNYLSNSAPPIGPDIVPEKVQPEQNAKNEVPEQPVKKSMEVVETPEDVMTPENPNNIEFSKGPVNLLKYVDLKRDVSAGQWQQTKRALTGANQARIYLPGKPPEDYQLRLAVRRIEGADAISVGFMMDGRQGLVSFDLGGGATALSLDNWAPGDVQNNARHVGRVISDQEISTILLTVHPKHFQAQVNGLTLIDWIGDARRLNFNSEVGMGSRESTFISIAGAKYVIEDALLTPLASESLPERAKRLESVIDIIPLLDAERDAYRSNWIIDKTTVRSTDELARLLIPTEVPEEYTLSATIVCPSESDGEPIAVLGLVVGEHQCLFAIKYNVLVGLDAVDGTRMHENESSVVITPTKYGVPLRIDATVTKDGIRVEVGGRTMVNWRGDQSELSIVSDWQTPNSRKLMIGRQGSLVLSDIKLGPPKEAPAFPNHAPLVVGKPLDLLPLIQTDRDALSGTWERNGTGLRCRGDAPNNKLVIPVKVPEEYKLTMRVARVRGAANSNEALHLQLPVGSVNADVVLDGMGSTVSGISVDYQPFNENSSSSRGGPVIPPGGPRDIVATVRKTGVTITSKGTPVIDWVGNPARFTYVVPRVTPCGQISLGSANQSFRFEKIELEPLASTGFPEVGTLTDAGKLLPLLHSQRDSRKGDWKIENGELISPTVQVSRFRIPVTPADSYVFSTTVERKISNGLIYLGLVVGGHPIAIALDGSGFTSALDLLDGKRSFDPANFTNRTYPESLFPQNQKVRVRCTVLPDSILVVCGDKEVIRWHGDPRRLSEVHDFRAPNPSEADHSNLWIGVWESQFAFSDLELKPLDAADRAASQFTGVFPATPQSNVPLAIVRP